MGSRSSTSGPDEVEEEEPGEFSFPFLATVINSALVGVAGISLMYPLDLVKTRLQSQAAMENGKPIYNGIGDCMRKTYASEGLRGLYRGLTVAVFMISPERIIKLTANDYFRHGLSNASGGISFPRELLAGGLAGVCQSLSSTPMELLKIRMQSAGWSTAVWRRDKCNIRPLVEYLTATTLGYRILLKKGVAGFYEGFPATLLRDTGFSLIFFPMFANLYDYGLEDNTEEPPHWWSFMSGVIAGVTAAVSVTPLDVIKTRLQERMDVNFVPYKGTVDAFQKILHQEGLRTFFKGAVVRALTISPIYGILPVVYHLGVGEKIASAKILNRSK